MCLLCTTYLILLKKISERVLASADGFDKQMRYSVALYSTYLDTLLSSARLINKLCVTNNSVSCLGG